MRRLTLLGLLLAIGAALAYWGEAAPDRSEANAGTPTMQFRVESGASTCTPMVNPTACTVPGTGTFQLAVTVTAFPPDPDGPPLGMPCTTGCATAGYAAMTTDIDWTGTGLVYKPTTDQTAEVLLPGGTLAKRLIISATRVQHGSLSAGSGATPSTFKGVVISLRFNCTSTASTNVITLNPASPLNPGGAALSDSFATVYPLSDSITINCVSASLDTDGDGCTDLREMGTNPMQGGQRNHNYFWDFYDTPDANNMRDRVITTTGDLLRVARRIGANDAMGTALINRNSDPLAGPPPPLPGYHPAFDRSWRIGPNQWDLGPPDGTITVITDLLGVARQMAHNCLSGM